MPSDEEEFQAPTAEELLAATSDVWLPDVWFQPVTTDAWPPQDQPSTLIEDLERLRDLPPEFMSKSLGTPKFLYDAVASLSHLEAAGLDPESMVGARVLDVNGEWIATLGELIKEDRDAMEFAYAVFHVCPANGRHCNGRHE